MDEPKQKPKRRVWVKLLFGVSLMLNLLVLGAVAGAAWRHGGPDARSGGGGPSGGIAMLRAMEREDRRAVLKSARASKPAPSMDRQARSAALVAALRAEPLDREMLTRLLTEQRTETDARLQVVSEAWLEHVQTMPVEARLSYAQRLEDGAARRGGKSKK